MQIDPYFGVQFLGVNTTMNCYYLLRMGFLVVVSFAPLIAVVISAGRVIGAVGFFSLESFLVEFNLESDMSISPENIDRQIERLWKCYESIDSSGRSLSERTSTLIMSSSLLTGLLSVVSFRGDEITYGNYLAATAIVILGIQFCLAQSLWRTYLGALPGTFDVNSIWGEIELENSSAAANMMNDICLAIEHESTVLKQRSETYNWLVSIATINVVVLCLAILLS